jgi:DNA mismatch repair protein MutS
MMMFEDYLNNQPKKSEKPAPTPLMRQYEQIKRKHPTAILLFRVGDFYETFGQDAIKAARILDITLTKRANGSASEIELAGFPYHALDNYLPKLVRAGERVAICDQLEDPKTAKGIVKRGITELVTPGLTLSDNVLENKKNNYLASIFIDEKAKDRNKSVGISFLDLSTGEFLATEGSLDYVEKLLQGFLPAELIYAKPQKKLIETLLSVECSTFPIEEWIYSQEYAYEKLIQHFKTQSLKGFGFEERSLGIWAAGAILFYLETTEHYQTTHITHLARIDQEKYVWLDKFTIRNLEILRPQHENGTSLWDILDVTQTPMGARMLRKWLTLPLKSKTEIEERQEKVAYFVAHDEQRATLRHTLKEVGDLERLVSKIATGRINPREMVKLKNTLALLPALKTLLLETPLLADFGENLALCTRLLNLLTEQLHPEPPLLLHAGNVIKSGVFQDLDEYREISTNSKNILEKIRQEEAQRTGIASLKISYNKVFGYYIEVRNTYKNRVPKEWIRKQTLTAAERYITPQLKELEEKILAAEERISTLEAQYYEALVAQAMLEVLPIQKNAQILAQIDVLTSFAVVAEKYRYTRPQISDSHIIDIKGGRHPVIERSLEWQAAKSGVHMEYVPNDLYLDSEKQQIIIITGPNMAGKSALLRQTALIVLMAQIGSFVPAQTAQIGIVDKIFTRVGASDNLSQGESTFMVEMTETASILNNLSERSLVLMDEIGRGTSTYDGISIAWAIVEYLHEHPTFRAKTLFATHYHELNELANLYPRIRNFNVSVREIGGKIVFLRKLQAGGSSHSFGINVAQLAGMPRSVVLRASEMMAHFEKMKSQRESNPQMAQMAAQMPQWEQGDKNALPPQYEILKQKLSELDINRVSPVEALLKLHELQNLIR